MYLVPFPFSPVPNGWVSLLSLLLLLLLLLLLSLLLLLLLLSLFLLLLLLFLLLLLLLCQFTRILRQQLLLIHLQFTTPFIQLKKGVFIVCFL